MKNADKCAFPIKADTVKDEYIVSSGLSKREYFAGLAMQGILANPYAYRSDTLDIAKTAVDFADKLLKALEE